MQEKIANLEIKIFYDSAITKKKVRELSKRQRARSVHGTLQVAGRGPGSDTQKTRRETPTHLPLQPQEQRRPPVSTTPQQLSRRVSGQDQRPLGTFRKVLPALRGTGMSPRPGTQTGQSVPVTALGAHQEVPHFTLLLLGWGPP